MPHVMLRLSSKLVPTKYLKNINFKGAKLLVYAISSDKCAVYNMTDSLPSSLDGPVCFFFGFQDPTGKSSLPLISSLLFVSLVPLLLPTPTMGTFPQAVTSDSLLYIFSLLVSTLPRCISYLLLHNKGPQNLTTKTTNICYLTVSSS